MDRQALEAIYDERVKSPDQMAAHMARLRALAMDCETAVEFGVRRANSTVALLLGAGRQLTSYDIEWSGRYADLIERIQKAAGPKWVRLTKDSREADFIDTDLLFIDSMHTYEHLKAELDNAADRVKRYLVFHDTISHGSIGQDAKMDPEIGMTTWTPNPKVLGIRPAIDELMIRDRSWRLVHHFTDHSGLLVLERV